MENDKIIAQTDIGEKDHEMKIVQFSVNKPDRKNWVEIIPSKKFLPNHGKDVVFVTSGKIVASYWKDGVDKLMAFDMKDGS